MASEAFCFQCQEFVGTAECVRDVPFDDGIGIVPQIPVFACLQCDAIVAIPACATPAIKAARAKVVR